MKEIEKYAENLSSAFKNAAAEISDMIENIDDLQRDPFLRDVWWNQGKVFENKMDFYTDTEKPMSELTPEEIEEKNRTEIILQKTDRIFENIERQIGD